MEKVERARFEQRQKMGRALRWLSLFSFALAAVQYTFNLYLGGTYETPLAFGFIFYLMGFKISR